MRCARGDVSDEMVSPGFPVIVILIRDGRRKIYFLQEHPHDRYDETLNDGACILEAKVEDKTAFISYVAFISVMHFLLPAMPRRLCT